LIQRLQQLDHGSGIALGFVEASRIAVQASAKFEQPGAFERILGRRVIEPLLEALQRQRRVGSMQRQQCLVVIERRRIGSG